MSLPCPELLQAVGLSTDQITTVMKALKGGTTTGSKEEGSRSAPGGSAVERKENIPTDPVLARSYTPSELLLKKKKNTKSTKAQEHFLVGHICLTLELYTRTHNCVLFAYGNICCLSNFVRYLYQMQLNLLLVPSTDLISANIAPICHC